MRARLVPKRLFANCVHNGLNPMIVQLSRCENLQATYTCLTIVNIRTSSTNKKRVVKAICLFSPYIVAYAHALSMLSDALTMIALSQISGFSICTSPWNTDGDTDCQDAHSRLLVLARTSSPPSSSFHQTIMQNYANKRNMQIMQNVQNYAKYASAYNLKLAAIYKICNACKTAQSNQYHK